MKKWCGVCENTGQELVNIWRRFNGNEGEEITIKTGEICEACDGIGWTYDKNYGEKT